MAWLQIILPLGELDAGTLESELLRMGALAVTLQDAGDEPIYEPPADATRLWRKTGVSALFPADTNVESVLNSVQNALGLNTPLKYKAEILENRDWSREWLRNFKPARFGRKVWICPTTSQPPEPDAINIRLDPGLAFGTGTHPTTAMCLEWLDAQSDRLAGAEVIDYGCGSGILAITALKLGARHAWAVDNDTQALNATAENALRNDIISDLTICAPENLEAAAVDCLIANILANPLSELAPRLADLVRPDGFIVLSGILRGQSQNVMSAYKRWFTISTHAEREDWVCLAGKRNQS
ncbi:MAG: 50S ribosomal protein L11 methyltransferase [Gammaproteobacteria bacterium]|nr:50S ribosomal protein L11 methyltransferase [Gammaproteobacteria bacterium]